MLALHALVFWVMARWSHGSAHATNLGAAELALLCQRHGDGSAAAAALAEPHRRPLLLFS
jgi:hypothetical protein